jgi:hypothetical protein
MRDRSPSPITMECAFARGAFVMRRADASRTPHGAHTKVVRLVRVIVSPDTLDLYPIVATTV